MNPEFQFLIATEGYFPFMLSIHCSCGSLPNVHNRSHNPVSWERRKKKDTDNHILAFKVYRPGSYMAIPEPYQVEVNNCLKANGFTETEIIVLGQKVRLISGTWLPGCVYLCIRQQDITVFSWFVLQTTSALRLLRKST